MSASGIDHDIEQLRKVASWWERWRVLVGGAVLLFTLVSGIWTLSGQLTSIGAGVEEVKKKVDEVAADGKATRENVDALKTRVVVVEESRTSHATETALFWSRDWPSIIARLSRIENRVFGLPELRETPPGSGK